MIVRVLGVVAAVIVLLMLAAGDWDAFFFAIVPAVLLAIAWARREEIMAAVRR